MKLRGVRSQQEMTFPKASEILHQSFPSKTCINTHQKAAFKGRQAAKVHNRTLLPSVPSPKSRSDTFKSGKEGVFSPSMKPAQEQP